MTIARNRGRTGLTHHTRCAVVKILSHAAVIRGGRGDFTGVIFNRCRDLQLKDMP